jgi:hypothetical protein
MHTYLVEFMLLFYLDLLCFLFRFAPIRVSLEASSRVFAD